MDIQTYYQTVFYVLAGAIGLCVGSFLNVVIYRLPNNMSIVSPPSHCPKCNTPIKWYDNIPVVSYILLKGKCRNCKVHISFRYTSVELLNGALWLLCANVFGISNLPYAIISMITCSVLLCVFFIDLEHMIILDRFHIILAVLGIASVFFEEKLFGDEIGWLSHIIGFAIGFSVFALIGFVGSKIAGREAMGGGDIKLCGVMGLYLGWQKFILSIVVASVIACLVLLTIKIIKHDKDKEYPFAPFLTTGFAVAMIFGNPILELYFNMLML